MSISSKPVHVPGTPVWLILPTNRGWWEKNDQEQDQGSKRQCTIRLFTCLSSVKRFMSDLSPVSIRIWHETMLWSSFPRDSETTRIGMDGNWAVFKFLYIIHIHITYCLVDGKSHVMSQTNQKKNWVLLPKAITKQHGPVFFFQNHWTWFWEAYWIQNFVHQRSTTSNCRRSPCLNHDPSVLILHCVGDLPPMAWEPHHWAEQ